MPIPLIDHPVNFALGCGYSREFDISAALKNTRARSEFAGWHPPCSYPRRSKHARADSPGIRLVTMHTFDLRRTLVPFSLLEIRQRFKEMQPGDSMVVLWSDVGAADDLLRILPAASFDIVSRAGIPEDPGGLRMELTKK